MSRRKAAREGADGGWCRRRSSKPFRGARTVPGGFDSHTLPFIAVALVAILLPIPGLGQEPAEGDSVRSPVLVEPTGPAPLGAFFKSLVLPGWGQFAADQPVRGAFYVSAQAATLYFVFRTQSRINQAEEDGSVGLANARRAQREDWIALAVFWSLASAVDAWVSAHLWGFEGEVVPPPDGSAGLALRYRIALSGP